MSDKPVMGVVVPDAVPREAHEARVSFVKAQNGAEIGELTAELSRLRSELYEAQKTVREYQDQSHECAAVERACVEAQTEREAALSRARIAEERAERAEADAAAMRPRCDWCGEPATTRYSTEGDGQYWLCDSNDADHRDQYCGIEEEKLGDAGTRFLAEREAMQALAGFAQDVVDNLGPDLRVKPGHGLSFGGCVTVLKGALAALDKQAKEGT